MSIIYSMLKCHPARLSQLKLLAVSRGEAASAVFEHLLNFAIERGELPDRLDGIDIDRQDDRVLLVLADQAQMSLTIPDVRTLASRLGGFAARTVEGSSTTHTLTDGTEITIRRAGRGFSIASQGARIVVTAGMVGDIGRQLRGAAA